MPRCNGTGQTYHRALTIRALRRWMSRSAFRSKSVRHPAELRSPAFATNVRQNTPHFGLAVRPQQGFHQGQYRHLPMRCSADHAPVSTHLHDLSLMSEALPLSTCPALCARRPGWSLRDRQYQTRFAHDWARWPYDRAYAEPETICCFASSANVLRLDHYVTFAVALV